MPLPPSACCLARSTNPLEKRRRAFESSHPPGARPPCANGANKATGFPRRGSSTSIFGSSPRGTPGHLAPVIYSGITVAYNKPLFILGRLAATGARQNHARDSPNRFHRDLMESRGGGGVCLAAVLLPPPSRGGASKSAGIATVFSKILTRIRTRIFFGLTPGPP